MTSIDQKYFLFLVLAMLCIGEIFSQANHPQIYISNSQKEAFLTRSKQSEKVRMLIADLQTQVEPYVTRHQSEPEWIVARLQMYWKTKYTRVYVNGMDFSHGEGQAPVPTVRFSGSRDWATDYLVPALEDVLPYMDDERGLYLQNGAKEGRPWEWTPPAKTGHVIERINENILQLAEEAAFLYWLTQEEKYAIFAADIFLKYMEGMYYREPPSTVGDHKNAKLMGLQTFEVIHERIVVPITIVYDFLYPYLSETGKDLVMITDVLKKWVEQEIKFGVPGNNWNLMQARYITYLALALEDDDQYTDGKGQQYYLDQMINQNSEKQKALVDVLKNFDPATGIWPETAGYSTGVSEDILEVICLIDRVQNNRPLSAYPLVEKAILATFQYLFPHGFTVAFGDAKHSRLRFNALELLIAQYRKYGEKEKEELVTAQLKNFIAQDAYDRKKIKSLFELFLYVDELMEVPPATGITDLVTPVFYAPNVCWLVQRNGMEAENGMMISENASLGNHSHSNGINMELYAKGLVFAPDCAAGVSYWSADHREYYSRFPAHNTVVVDGQSNYGTMLSDHAFSLQACYPKPESQTPLTGPYTFSSVTFTEPSTNAQQQRLTATIRTSENSGYFIDIFRSAREDGNDLKHEYLFHSQGDPIVLLNAKGDVLKTAPTDELSSAKGDLVGYDYFKEKQEVTFDGDFVAQFNMPAPPDRQLQVRLWMRGYPARKIFTVMAPPSRAISKESVPEALYQQPLPTLVVRQQGEARTRPFVSLIEAFEKKEGAKVEQVNYFTSQNENPAFIGLKVDSAPEQVDYIFNDEKGEAENIIGRHKFQGIYGIVSYLGAELNTLFLGEGKQLESETWKIVSAEKRNTVLLQKNADKVRISAYHKFRLTMPLPDSSKKEAVLEVVGGSDDTVFQGSIFTIGQQRLAVFELPGMDDVVLKWH